ncbi:hypothetical protein SELMODRAFT_422417 [Selaginella moellendorffii]|uniref:PIN domain-containing protein n=1 Tax=Selaginella moellendorffii TaxID=88036 RepID=D8SIB7_SELML|nr:hypothetical protein SELMODRAFT_422417 [Selaginella moellendorffii]
MVKKPWWIHVQKSNEMKPMGMTPPVSPSVAENFLPYAVDLLSPTNDDHVLDCALLFERSVVEGRVVLLTSDPALKIKAMAELSLVLGAGAVAEAVGSVAGLVEVVVDLVEAVDSVVDLAGAVDSVVDLAGAAAAGDLEGAAGAIDWIARTSWMRAASTPDSTEPGREVCAARRRAEWTPGASVAWIGTSAGATSELPVIVASAGFDIPDATKQQS